MRSAPCLSRTRTWHQHKFGLERNPRVPPARAVGLDIESHEEPERSGTSQLHAHEAVGWEQTRQV